MQKIACELFERKVDLNSLVVVVMQQQPTLAPHSSSSKLALASDFDDDDDDSIRCCCCCIKRKERRKLKHEESLCNSNGFMCTEKRPANEEKKLIAQCCIVSCKQVEFLSFLITRFLVCLVENRCDKLLGTCHIKMSKWPNITRDSG